MSYKIKTFGCRLNFYESKLIRKFTDANNNSDLVCMTVTGCNNFNLSGKVIA